MDETRQPRDRTLEERFRLLYKITSQTSLSIQAQLQEALQLACRFLDLDIGIISRVEGAEYRVEYFYPDESGLSRGQTFKLGDTYCSITLQEQEVMMIDDMTRSPHRRHPCYNIFELESYIGAPVVVDNELFGTLNFSGAEPREEPFTEADEDFIRLLAEWVADILKQRAIEHDLQETREMYRLVSMKAADMICLHDPDGTYRFVSPSVKEILGYRPEELVGTSPYKLFHPDDLQRIEEQSHEQAVAGERVRSMQYRIRRKDGRYVWFETSTEPILDQDGQLKKLRTGSRDISRRKQLELLLKETNALAKVGGWEYHLKTGEMVWTDEVYHIHELPKGEEIEIEKALDHYPEPARAKISEALSHALSTGEGYDMELPFITAKGNEKWVRAIGRAHMDGEEVYKLSGVFQDLTERRKMEDELRSRNQELKKLHDTTNKIYSVIGHDLRSPITSVMGFSELALMDLDEAETDETLEGIREKMAYINQSTVKLAWLLDDLLSWSRAQTDDLKLSISTFPVRKIVDDALDIQRMAARNKQVEIEVALKQNFQVQGDERMLATIIRNLLSNAVKYSDQGSTVRLEVEEDGDTWTLRVADEGMGMEQEVLDGLFDNTAASREGTSNEQGTGIGLVLCRELAQLHGGTIAAESTPGEGSVFTVRIPRRVRDGAD